MFEDIEKEAAVFVTSLFAQFCNASFVFHTLQHTKNVVQRTEEIAEFYNLENREKTLLIISAWFHDTGYLLTQPNLHEQKSVDIMRDFLKHKQLSDDFINAIDDCIIATKFLTAPQTLPEQILCDADTYHLGTKAFLQTNEQVFQEFKNSNNKLTRAEFDKKTLELLELHQFHTGYCRALLSEGKKRNIETIKEKISSE